MLSIGQFSKACQISIKTLHHYDKIGLMHPGSIDASTGYRYYNADQISTMLLIQRLKRYGFSLADIKGFLSCGDQRALFSKLEEQKNMLRGHIAQTALIIKEIDQHLIDFERTGDIMGYQSKYTVQLQETADRTILSSRQKMGTDEFGKYFGKLYERIAKEQIKFSGRTLTLYHDEVFDPKSSDIEVALVIEDKEKATRILAGGLCASTVHHGGYASISDAYGAILKWIQQNDYEIVSAPYEIYMKTQFDKLPPEQWETEIFFPVKKK
ncbi:MAG: MerR family transcriptional regulator [Christensenellales bacterium]